MQIQRDDLILPGAPPREGGAAHVPTASRARLPQSAKGQLLWKRGTALPRPGGEGAPPARIIFPGIPRAQRATALPDRGFDIAAEKLNYSISDSRGRSRL